MIFLLFKKPNTKGNTQCSHYLVACGQFVEHRKTFKPLIHRSRGKAANSIVDELDIVCCEIEGSMIFICVKSIVSYKQHTCGVGFTCWREHTPSPRLSAPPMKTISLSPCAAGLRLMSCGLAVHILDALCFQAAILGFLSLSRNKKPTSPADCSGVVLYLHHRRLSVRTQTWGKYNCIGTYNGPLDTEKGDG